MTKCFLSPNLQKALRFSQDFAPQLNNIQTAPVRKLLNWYQSFSDEPPSKKDFDILDHWAFAAHIFIIERLTNDSFSYRINGEKVIEIIGHNQCGNILQKDNTDPKTAIFLEYLTNVLAQGLPCRNFGDLEMLDRKFIQFESIDCPVLDKNGQMNIIIGAIAMINS